MLSRLLLCLPFCARYLCIMKGEVGGERKERTQLLFLVAIYGIFHSFSSMQTNLRFLFSDEHKNSSFVSLIDFCNNSSHFAYMRMRELMNYASARLWSRKMTLKMERSKQSDEKQANGKRPSEFNLINSFGRNRRFIFCVSFGWAFKNSGGDSSVHC